MSADPSSSKLWRLLAQWREKEYEDEEAARITGLSVRSLRDLRRWGAIKTSSGSKGRGKVRTWKCEALSKAAMTHAFHDVGMDLQTAARLTFLVWNARGDSLMEPVISFCLSSLDLVDLARSLPRDNGEYALVAWLREEHAVCRHDDEYDLFVLLIDQEYVFTRFSLPGRITILKDVPDPRLRCIGRMIGSDGSFLSWEVPARKRMWPLTPEEERDYNRASDKGEFMLSLQKNWQIDYEDEVDFKFLSFEVDTQQDQQRANAALHNYVTMISVNVSLSMRMAMRRSLALPVAR